MRYLITGTGPWNKGAELMLLAVVQEVRQFDFEAIFVADPGCGPYEWRARLGLAQLFDPDQSGHFWWLRKHLFHEGYRKRFGLVLPEEVDVVLDASGFAFGDHWKPEWVEGAAEEFERYRARRAKVVLLPQAFGPFTVPRIRDATRRILAASHLTFARDHESFARCVPLSNEPASILKAPDFTNTLEGVLPESWVIDPLSVAVVPNRQMLLKGDDASRKSYEDLMVSAIRLVKDRGYKPFLLVHESADQELAERLAEEAGFGARVVRRENPLELKGILGACAFLIGSRFHSLVSALSQGVPCVGTSWSHKYRELFHDYGVEDYVSCWSAGEHEWLARVAEVTEPRTQATLRAVITERAEWLKLDTRATWKTVEAAISRLDRHPPSAEQRTNRGGELQRGA